MILFIIWLSHCTSLCRRIEFNCKLLFITCGKIKTIENNFYCVSNLFCQLRAIEKLRKKSLITKTGQNTLNSENVTA